MSNVNFDFEFRSGKIQGGALAFMTAKISVDGELLATLTNWTVRDGKNGIWFAPPSQEYTDKQGQKKYSKYAIIGAQAQDTQAPNKWRQAFELEAKRAFAAHQNGGGRNQVADAFAPNQATRAPVGPPRGPSLPPGWNQGIDTASGKPYFISPQGVAQWENPSGNRVAPPPAVAPVGPPPAQADDPFSQFGGNNPFDDGPLPNRD